MEEIETKKKVGFLFGGMSSEHKISCISAASMLENIDTEKYEIIKIGITQEGKWFVYNGAISDIKSDTWSSDAKNLVPAIISPCSAHHGIILLDKAAGTFKIARLDCVLSILHGENGEDGVMQGLLTLAGVPFVGCDTRSSALCMDKTAAKSLLENYSIKTAPYFVVDKREFISKPEYLINKIVERFEFPVFVKPAGTGSSVGISKAMNKEVLEKALSEALKFDKKVLVEKAISGKEIEVAVLERAHGKLESSVCGEIDPGSDFYDYETKYETETASYFIPARISQETACAVRELACRIFSILGCNGFSRVDFFVDGDTIIFNEINTLPGFTSISMYPKLWGYMGLSYASLLEELIENACGGYVINE